MLFRKERSSTVTTLTPAQTRALLAEGAVLIDIREPDEHRRMRIPGARNMPLSSLARIEAPHAKAIVFHCRSGARTAAQAQRLLAAADCPVYLLDGGIEAWRAAGHAVELDRRQPIEVQRQVQIAAGGLVVTGLALGLAVEPAFFGLAGFVGLGLVFAGATGWCGLAQLLRSMPWNRPT
jgi:rhodanese-related sulfurtransferase